ncbi:SulP family inorganic anion transporter [Albibacterium profundi]|uniref:SulP family inorganic anion transporter n=1 Tax=Albibacterium profundi TaxID=3134906 RepID=A0ABV5CGH9_9SPHI
MKGTRVSAFFKLSKRDLKYDIPASIVVFLVALPLCLGIAMASGAPLFAGILTGIIGGLVIASFSGSQLSVSGPAAGLTVIVLGAIQSLGAYPTFLLAVVLAGVLQMILFFAKAGNIGNFFPSSVIMGMLAAIGITIIIQQIPYGFGLSQGMFSTGWEQMFSSISWGAVAICIASIVILVGMPKIKKLKAIPAPLVVVLLGLAAFQLFKGTPLEIQNSQLVQIPVVASVNDFLNLFIFPDFSQILNKDVWIVAFTIAIIASIETLLSIEAIDKIDPMKRTSNTNRELLAQGIGNMTSGLLGGLPLTSVIVRSSANVNAGGRSRQSAMFHGLWLLLALVLFPVVINMIPLACLAAILLVTGYKLANPALFVNTFKRGVDQFVPFIATVIAIILTDLLTGVGVGIVISLLYVLRNNMRNSFDYGGQEEEQAHKVVVTLSEEVSFLNKPAIRFSLQNIPRKVNEIVIDGRKSKFIDKDVILVIKEYEALYVNRGKIVQLLEVENKQNFKSIKKNKNVSK